jgi:uncharacterized protein (DUF2141 family)
MNGYLKWHVALLFSVALFSRSVEASAETVTVRVTGFRGNVGKVDVMLWKEGAGFPTQPEKSVARKSVQVTGAQMEVSFTGLPKGRYAVAAYQDLNSNGSLDRSLLGWPTEPVGASNGATGMFGPPRFRDAAFELKQATQLIEVKLK